MFENGQKQLIKNLFIQYHTVLYTSYGNQPTFMRVNFTIIIYYFYQQRAHGRSYATIRSDVDYVL